MKKEKVRYDNEMEAIITFAIRQHSSSFLVDSRYLYFHNHTCPKCRRRMINKKGEVQAATLSFFYPSQASRYVVPYTLCNACFKHSKKSKKEIVLEHNKLIDHYILKQLEQE